MDQRPFRVPSRALLAVALLLALAAGACGGGDSSARNPDSHRRPGRAGRAGRGAPPAKPAAVPVVVCKVERGDMDAYLDGSATLVAEESVDVVSEATGVVVKILVEEGDRVRKGDTLARLEYRELELAERKARSDFERLKADFARAEALAKDSLLSQEDYQKTKFDLEAARIEWEQRKLNLERTRIVAPISGTITQRMISLGDLVQANTPVFQVVDFRSLVAPVYVPEKRLPQLHVRQAAFVLAGGRRRGAHVLRISPLVDAQSGTVKVTLALDDRTGLRPGMFTPVQIVLDRHEGVPVAPKRALVFEDEIPYLFVANGGKAVRRRVRLGYQDSERAEILEGVTPGEWVVLVGQSALKDGSAVAAQTEAGKPVEFAAAPAEEKSAGTGEPPAAGPKGAGPETAPRDTPRGRKRPGRKPREGAGSPHA